jgi:hypothetical protein
VDCKSLCRSLFMTYPTMHPLVSRIPSLGCIVRLAIIIPSLMTPCTIYGPLVSCFLSSTAAPQFNLFAVLDPHISYEGLLSNCADNLTMQCHVECVRDQLCQYYLDNYAKKESVPVIQPTITETSSGSPQKVNSQYKKHPSAMKDKLEEFYKLPQEDFDTCDPIQWWAGHHSQFLNLSHLAWDILVIPGKFISSSKCSC